jgi:hypothetical protein
VQLSGVQPQHRLVCDALGLDSSWYAVPLAQKTAGTFRPLERGVKGKRIRKYPLGHTTHHSKHAPYTFGFEMVLREPTGAAFVH